MKIALSVGHYPSSPGATRNGYTEYGLSSAVIGDLTAKLDFAGHEAWIIGAGKNRDQVEEINMLNPDFGLELHFNNMASKPKWNGSLVMHSGSRLGMKLAHSIQNSVVGVLGTKNLGIVLGTYQLSKRKPLIEIIKNTVCPFVVIEPLFLSNDDDFKKLDINEISTGIFNGILGYIKEING